MQVFFVYNRQDIGKIFKVLIEGDFKKFDQQFKGWNFQNKMFVFDKVFGY